MRSLFSLATIFASAVSTVAAEEAATVAVAQKVSEEYSTSNRVGCAANLHGYHFNLKELSLPIDE